MTDEQTFSSLLEQKTNELIEKKFGYSIENGSQLFHFTNEEDGIPIEKTQVFWASFIRSTSDSLEFALPFSHCRDWLCLENNLLDFKPKGFPVEMFRHFNEQAIDPCARYFFISLTENQDSQHHESMYGKGTLKFSFDKIPKEAGAFFMALKCLYTADMKREVSSSLQEWRDLFLATIQEVSFDMDKVKMESWFYIFMRYCHMCALCIKQEAFQDEKEVRLVFVPKNIEADSDCAYHEKRDTRPVSKASMLRREYLPVKLNALGITVSRLT